MHLIFLSKVKHKLTCHIEGKPIAHELLNKDVLGVDHYCIGERIWNFQRAAELNFWDLVITENLMIEPKVQTLFLVSSFQVALSPSFPKPQRIGY